MASKIKDIKEVDIPDTYELQKAEFVPEVDSFALYLKHKLSGARVLVLSNQDNNKVFSIGFRTTPKDATGVPHIIEHTVLCGSKNFPAKDPFVELVKGSLNTYLNASTYPDKTVYPVASCNEKDFENLMHVYMDAVFYPNIYEHEEIFKQEGWHYEMTEPDGDITYNGVVYNEMKGAYSSEESVLERYVMNQLFPDTTYGNDSGGDPACIPDLTYEEYLDFHRRYYHPVNSYIYLYGDMDVEERLNWMDEHYLKNFPKITLDSSVGFQPPFASMKSLETEYAVAQKADCSEKTYYSFAAAMDLTMDKVACKAFEMLSYVLVEMPGAPLKQALLDAGIGNDIDADFCDIVRQSYYTIQTKNAKPGEKEKFYKIIRETLEKVVREGVDKKALEAAMNGYEFKEREADFGSFPKGLLYGLKALRMWLYDDDKPYEALCYESQYKKLREYLSTDYYEQLIQKYLLDNPHAVLVEMKPKKGLSEEAEKKEKERLAAYKASLTPEQIQQVIDDTKALKAYQEEPTPKEILEKIPVLEREDIGKEVQPYYNKEVCIHGLKAVHHEINTNGIVYFNMIFDMTDLKEHMAQASLLSTLLGYMDTKQHTYNEFDTETNFYTGGISSETKVFCMYQKPEEYHLTFEVRTKVLESKVEDAVRLMEEMMFETLFSDDKHLKEVIAECRSRMKVRLMSSGHTAAVGRALSYHTESNWLNDQNVGIGYYQYLEEIDDHFEEEKENLKKGMVQLLHKIFRKDHLVLSCNCSENGLKQLEQAMEKFVEKLDAFEGEKFGEALEESLPAVPIKLEVKEEGFTTPAEIQYVALAGDYQNLKDINMGAMMILRHLLSYGYLWNEVRVKGGAYGVMCGFNQDKDGFFVSYRDPKLSETLEIYRKVVDYLKTYQVEEREMLKTVIGTISGMDTPLTPAMKGMRSMKAYLTKTPIEYLEKTRAQVLACDCEDIRNTARVVEAVIRNGHICVIGNEQHIKKESSLFKEVTPLSK